MVTNIRYKADLHCFRGIANDFLKYDSKTKNRVEYCGYIGASEILNPKIIGKENYDYVIKRYYFNRKS
jgi:hypothetical protein